MKAQYLALFLLASAATAQVPKGATVYIEPDAGYEAYLTAALSEQHVPLEIVTDRTKATYILRSTVTRPESSHAAVVVNNTSGRSSAPNSYIQDVLSSSASISLVDPKSSVVIFAYTAGGEPAMSANSCAKHLRRFIGK